MNAAVAPWDLAGRLFPCAQPSVADCSAGSPAVSANSDRLCYFHAQSCGGTPAAAVDCDVASYTEQRFCLCTEQRSRRRRVLVGATEHGTPAPVGSAAAIRSSPHGLLAVAAAVVGSALLKPWMSVAVGGALRGGGRRWPVVVAVASLGLILGGRPAAAHNWVGSWSRSKGYANGGLCRVRGPGEVHAQIGPGQTFQVHTAAGHGGPIWLIVVREDNFHKLEASHVTKVAQHYIDMAPEGTNTGMDERFKRYHLSVHGAKTCPSCTYLRQVTKENMRETEADVLNFFEFHPDIHKGCRTGYCRPVHRGRSDALTRWMRRLRPAPPSRVLLAPLDATASCDDPLRAQAGLG